MSEQALNNSFLGGFSAVLDALDIVSIIILLIMMLILGTRSRWGCVSERPSTACFARSAFSRGTSARSSSAKR